MMNELRKLTLERVVEKKELVREVKVLSTDAKVRPHPVGEEVRPHPIGEGLVKEVKVLSTDATVRPRPVGEGLVREVKVLTLMPRPYWEELVIRPHPISSQRG